MYRVLICVCLAGAAANPAKDLWASLRSEMPADPVKFVEEVLAAEAASPKALPGDAKILVVGDSWASVVGSEGPLPSFLERKLKVTHGCNVSLQSIAIPGTMTSDWAAAGQLKALQLAAVGRDYVFVMLMGNDALDQMPDCAGKVKTAKACGDELMAFVTPNMEQIVTAVHEVNPKARVVGFGYDTMFGGYGCGLVTRALFPQCYIPKVGAGNSCFNTQFLRIQSVWDDLAAKYSFVDSASILGATQVAGGDTNASTDPNNRHIDMDKMGPAKYWPDYLGCFHPGVVGGADSGASVTMEEFYKVYWSKQPACSKPTSVLV